MSFVTKGDGLSRKLMYKVERLRHDLSDLGEKPCEIGRRLDDRIRLLVTKAKELPINSPARKQIMDLIKSELSEYFEREKNPSYSTDRRSSD